jgi:hypothetical protein
MLYAAAERRRDAMAAARENTLQLVQLASANHERLIESTRQILTVLSTVPAVTDDDPIACSAFLATLGRVFSPRYQGFVVAELDGMLRCNSIEVPENTNIADRRYFKLAVETGTSLSVTTSSAARLRRSRYSASAIPFGMPTGRSARFSRLVSM